MRDLIHVMIVDDEKLALEDLSTIVDWQAYGFEIVATAYNGAQAFTKYLQFQPQVIITDIKMPIMDGIALIQKIRETDQQVLFLLLTAYADFTYARTAIRLGITDYIIKSEITAQSMGALLSKLRTIVEKQRQSRNILTGTMLESFFARQGSPVPEVAKTLLSRQYTYLVLERDLPLMLDGSQATADGRLTTAGLKHLLREQRYDELDLVSVCTLMQNRELVVLKPRDNSALRTYELLFRNAQALQETLERSNAGTVSLYLAMRPMDFYTFRRLLQNEAEIFAKRYFKPKGTLLPLEWLPSSDSLIPDPDKSAFEHALEQCDTDTAEKFLQQFYDRLAVCGNLAVLRTNSQELYFMLARRAELIPEHMRRPNLCARDNQIYWYNAADIGVWMTKKTRELLEILREEQQNTYSQLIGNAIAYVNAHYTDSELTLNEIADSLHISIGHLCLLFKQETGVTLKNYITNMRIETAKRLLRSSNTKIYGISEAVGYQTSQYFSQVFYKKVGMLPAEYRKMGGKEK
jgi:two-component system, response regulator YesN